jgi:hypothetical protein
MLSCSIFETFVIIAGPRSRRMMLPPSGRRQSVRALRPPLAQIDNLSKPSS